MRLTARQLNRATLARQLLLRREPLAVGDAVHRVVAIQAQEAPSPYVALWNRVEAFDPADLDRAFADQVVVKASLMRIALHAVHAADYPAFHEAMQGSLRASRLNDRRFRALGLTTAEADALVPDVLAYASEPRSNADMEAWLAERLGPLPKPGAWWALRTFAPVVHAPSGGAWSFGLRPSYVRARAGRHSGDREAALGSLVRRYLEGFGPASVQDVAQFAMVPRSIVREVVQSLGATLASCEGPDGRQLLDVPGAPLPEEDVPAPPRLLPMWDSVLLAYADRSRIIPLDDRRLVIRQNGDVLPTLLVDGRVVGVWRPVDEGIEATAFHRLPDDAWAGLESEARALSAFLAARDPTIYRRYAHWWRQLPRADVRTWSRRE